MKSILVEKFSTNAYKRLRSRRKIRVDYVHKFTGTMMTSQEITVHRSLKTYVRLTGNVRVSKDPPIITKYLLKVSSPCREFWRCYHYSCNRLGSQNIKGNWSVVETKLLILTQVVRSNSDKTNTRAMDAKIRSSQHKTCQVNSICFA